MSRSRSSKVELSHIVAFECDLSRLDCMLSSCHPVSVLQTLRRYSGKDPAIKLVRPYHTSGDLKRELAFTATDSASGVRLCMGGPGVILELTSWVRGTQPSTLL